jgi:tRNA nucleotidyltransferase (CCA-adding enzyme)
MLDGSRVMALGVKEGPPVGEMLRALLMARLDGEVSSRKDEERFVRRRLESRPRLPRVC